MYSRCELQNLSDEAALDGMSDEEYSEWMQNAPIYSSDPVEEELMIEYYSRYSFLKEVYAGMEDDDPGEIWEEYFRDKPAPVLTGSAFWYGCGCVDFGDEIPF